MSSSSLRWLLLVGLLLMVTALPAQPPSKGKSPPKAPPAEVEDPNAKPVKPPPQIDDVPKTDAAPADGPGVTPPPGVLVVGVRSLPELMSPRFARTDSERYALDLLFEGLLRPGLDGAGGRVYEPALARDLPAMAPLGRAFTMIDAVWADPAHPNENVPVTGGDVVSTVKKLVERKGQFGAEDADWLAPVTTDNNKSCRITLTRGHIDPLSLMTFKILPANRLDDPSFARSPIGSGPFTYAGRETKGGREYAMFPANPAYGRRASRPHLPRLSAVWMVLSRNPVSDFKNGLVHFVLTDHTEELAVLKPPARPDPDVPVQAGKLEVTIGNTGRVDTLFGRRVYFLAINHQKQKFSGEKGRELRRFLAHAIQRESILTACFRAGFEKHHQPLNGPFPPDTWPSRNPRAPVQLDDAFLARSKRPPGSPKVEVELKYPDGDRAVAQACKLIAEQVAELNAGVTINLKAVDAAKYFEEIAYNTDFELAHWHYDYPNDWFRPAGLLDRGAQGHQERNFMRYDPPSDMQALLDSCRDRRDFGVVNQSMQDLHLAFVTEMPFIPLWHLDAHALLASGLTTVPETARLDPLAPFTHIEQWSLR